MEQVNSTFEHIFCRLLAGEDLIDHEQKLSSLFEIIATCLWAQHPRRQGHYFDGVSGLRLTGMNPQMIKFKGNMWVGNHKTQWTESFSAKASDRRNAGAGIRIHMRVGSNGGKIDLLPAGPLQC